MKKKILLLLIISSLLIAAYIFLWCSLLFMPARLWNKEFAGNYINTSLINESEDYYIKFSEIVPYGFPFKLGFKIIGWTEESKVGKIECLEPLYIGYDLVKQRFYGYYSGETLAWHKPLQSKFGSKVVTEGYQLAIKIPFFKLLKIILSKSANKFEIINLIKSFELKSGKEQIFDIVGHEKLYDQEYKFLKLTFIKRKYYTNLEEFLNNLPSQIDIEQNAKINDTVLTKRALPPTILFGLNWPFAISGKNKIVLKINEPNINDFAKDLEVYFTAIDSVSDIHHGQAEVIYKGKIVNKDADIFFKINSQIEIKPKFFDRVFDSFKYLSNFVEYNNKNDLIKEGSPFKWVASNVLERLNNPTIRELEGRKYLFNIELDLSNKVRELKVVLNDFSLFSGSTGIVLRGQNMISQDFNWSINGKLGLNNQLRIAELLLKKDIFGVLHNYSNSAKELYADVSVQFLKSLSEYPLSTSNDISLEYSFGSKELKKGKVGNAEVENLTILFDLALYKEAVKRIGMTGYTPGMLQELAPTLSLEKQKVLEKIIVNPAIVEPDTWNELIK